MGIIRVFIKLKTGEIREYKDIACVREKEDAIEMDHLYGGTFSISMEFVEKVKVVTL